MLDLYFLISLQCSIDFHVFMSLFLFRFFSAKDCIIIIFIIVWHLYRLSIESIYFLCVECLCVVVCCFIQWLLFLWMCDCCCFFCLLLLWEFFVSSSFGCLLLQHWKQHSRKLKTCSKVFCSVVSVFCLVRGSCMLS